MSAFWFSFTTQPTELENEEAGQVLVRNPNLPETLIPKRTFEMQHVISYRAFVSISSVHKKLN
jgi:hypothetical protein